MASDHKVAANRKNSAKSTGPRSRAGKARSRLNALRHGLATRVANDVIRAVELERLASHFAGGASEDRVEQARVVAEAELDVLRVRSIRTALFDKAAVNPDPYFPAKNLTGPEKGEKSAAGETTDTNAPGDYQLSDLARAGRTDATMLDVLLDFTKLDRYERRALSRRKRAIREFLGSGSGVR